MRPQLPEDILVNLLRQCYFTPRCRSTIDRRPAHLHHHIRSFRISMRQTQRHGTNPETHGIDAQKPYGPEDGFLLAQSPHPSPTAPETNQTLNYGPGNIAILGGGITGLASAYYLSKSFPKASITLYEASNRMGGWLQSKQVNIGNGHIVFEQGPRSLRPGTPAGLVTLEMVITTETRLSN